MCHSVWKLGNYPHPPQNSSFKVNLISQGGRPSNINQIAAKLLINLSFFSTFCNWKIAREGVDKGFPPLALTFYVKLSLLTSKNAQLGPSVEVVSAVLWDCAWFYPSSRCSPLYRVLLAATISIMVTSAIPYCSQRWLSKVVKIQCNIGEKIQSNIRENKISKITLLSKCLHCTFIFQKGTKFKRAQYSEINLWRKKG